MSDTPQKTPAKPESQKPEGSNPKANSAETPQNNPPPAKTLGETIEDLKAKIKILKIEIFAMEPLDLGGVDIAEKIEQIKTENAQLGEEIENLKSQLVELEQEEIELEKKQAIPILEQAFKQEEEAIEQQGGSPAGGDPKAAPAQGSSDNPTPAKSTEGGPAAPQAPAKEKPNPS